MCSKMLRRVDMAKARRFFLPVISSLAILFVVLPGLPTPNAGFRFAATTTALAANAEDRGVQELRALVSSANGRPAEQDLLHIESRYSGGRAASLAKFLRGYLHYTGHDYPTAAAALDANAISSRSSIGDYALFYRAQSEAGANQNANALRDFRALNNSYSDSLMSHDAMIGAARSELALGDIQSALRDTSRLAQSGDPDALLIEAQANGQSGKKSEAESLYRKIYYYYPASSASVAAATALFPTGTPTGDMAATSAELKARADGLYASKQYAEAVAAYDQLAASFPESANADDVQLKLGIALLNSRSSDRASSVLSKISDRNPNAHAEALYYRAEALRRSQQIAESSTVVEKLVSQHRDSRWAQTALYNLAIYLDKKGRDSEASIKYRQIMALYPGSDYAAEASYNLGHFAYVAGRYSDAARMLEDHLATYRYPTSKFLGESGLWAAKSEEKLGNKRRALALYNLLAERYRFGYDGYIAQQRMAALKAAEPGLTAESTGPGSSLEKIALNLTAVQPVVETANGSESGRLSRADDLEVIGLTDQAIAEVNQALASAPSSPRLNLRLAQIYSHMGDTLQATIILRRAYPDLFSYKDSDLPREAWEIFFPLHYWNTIKEEAGRYGIDPYFAAGLIRQESVFNPNAISRVGARGLMQLMTPTARLVAKHQGDSTVSAADLYNPSVNIKLGMNYLAQMVGEFGKLEYAAAAYNAGPGRVRQWVAQRGSMNLEDWVESIPLSETRGYVQGVLRNEANYRRLYK